MKFSKPVSARRRRRSCGHVIMESALTMMPTFALILGFADVGMMLFRWSTLQNAVREGARYAITFNLESDGNGGSLGQDASVASVVERYAMGLVHADDSPQHIFVRYYSVTDVNTEIPAPGGNEPGNLVEVSIQNLSFSWMMPLSGTYNEAFLYSTSQVPIKVYASDLLGSRPAGVLAISR